MTRLALARWLCPRDHAVVPREMEDEGERHLRMMREYYDRKSAEITPPEDT